uniref:Peptidase S1 domain-containing protein n=1 Tax=Catharus ustulatus TaxID=91951 RepID=A0A8C3Y6J9_CATUS
SGKGPASPSLLSLLSYFPLSSYLSAQGVIIGGNEVVPHSRPYMAYVLMHVSNRSGSKAFYCGGFLIRPDAVLSAAHCVWNMLVFPGRRVNITVILGAHNIRIREWSQQWISVRDWVFHPRYSPDSVKYDIVLLRVWSKKSFLPEGSPPAHFPQPLNLVGTKCSVAGWGRTYLTGHSSNVMMEVDLKVEGRGNLFLKAGRACLIPLILFMTQGDSGGPLVCNQKAHGIVSHGMGRRLFPEVFTRVSYFEPWIRQQLRRFALQELPASPSSQ